MPHSIPGDELTLQVLRRAPPEASRAVGLMLQRLAHDLRSPLSGFSLDLFCLDSLVSEGDVPPIGSPPDRTALHWELREIRENLQDALARAIARVDEFAALAETLLEGAARVKPPAGTSGRRAP